MTNSNEKISVYIIAYNEKEKIKQCIESVQWADEIILADSHSTDGTTEIAEKLGAKVVHIEFHGYGQLRNEAISHCNNEWILSIDADERCTKEVKDELIEIIQNPKYDLYRIPRKNFFYGEMDKTLWLVPQFQTTSVFQKRIYGI